MNFKLLLIVALSFSLFNSSFFSNTTKPKPLSVWEVLTHKFSLDHNVERAAVQKQIQWIQKHPEYIEKMANQSKPFIYHIVNEIIKRHLPGELALIPMIESEFDPFSSSNKGAVGLWQIMPETAHDLGLQKNWWVDGRRSIGPSTSAALNYLTYLHQFFHGNWMLAVAAYDSGEGTVSRAVKRSRHKQFWSLSLPHETKAYIPKLLALSEIIKNPKRYHIRLPKIAHEPYFKEIHMAGHINLNHVAKLTEMSIPDLHRLNPGFKDWSHLPYRPYTLLIPKEKVEKLNKNMAKLSKK